MPADPHPDECDPPGLPPRMPDHDPTLHGLSPGDLFACAIDGAASSTPSGQWEPPDAEHLASLLPQYRIECLLGHGGMGAVYKGTQPGLERPIAIKILPAEVAADAQFVERFQREARTLASLQHSGIVAVYETGQTSGGHLYFVMEYVAGTDLHRMVHGPGLNPKQALALISQVCDALHYAHDKGVIHRDIKPGNILVTRDGRAKVADFGLARPVRGKAEGITRTAVVMGTPDYMAPEQRAGEADHRSDIFALGVMLYEMLTGQTPQGIFDPPSKRLQVDVRIDEVVVKALQQEPSRRYQRASEMKTDVDRIRADPPAKSAAEIQPAPRTKKSSLRTMTVVGLVAAGALLFCFPQLRPWKSQVLRNPEGTSTEALAAPAPAPTSAHPLGAEKLVAGDSLPLASSATGGTNSLTEEESAAGWRLLFNGRDLSGWNGPISKWTVRDGAITTIRGPGDGWGNSSSLTYPGHVFTDFILTWKARVVEASGRAQFGVGVRADWSHRGADNVIKPQAGYIAVIGPHPNDAGRLLWLYDKEQPAPNPVWPRGKITTITDTADGKGVSLVPGVAFGSNMGADVPVLPFTTDWCDYRIVARGNRVQFFTNERLSAEIVEERRAAPKSGGVTLVAGHHSLRTAQFKDIKLKPLPSETTPAPPGNSQSTSTNNAAELPTAATTAATGAAAATPSGAQRASLDSFLLDTRWQVNTFVGERAWGDLTFEEGHEFVTMNGPRGDWSVKDENTVALGTGYLLRFAPDRETFIASRTIGPAIATGTRKREAPTPTPKPTSATPSPAPTVTPTFQTVAIPVLNPGFETFSLKPDEFSRRIAFGAVQSSDPIPSWTLDPAHSDAGTQHLVVPSFPQSVLSTHRQVAYISQSQFAGVRGLPGGRYIRQPLPAHLSSGATYTLSVDVGHRKGFGFPDGGGYSVELLAGGTVLAADYNNTLRLSPGTFATTTIQATAPIKHPSIGKPLEIRLGLFNPKARDGQVNFDNVRLTASKPQLSPVGNSQTPLRTDASTTPALPPLGALVESMRKMTGAQPDRRGAAVAQLPNATAAATPASSTRPAPPTPSGSDALRTALLSHVWNWDWVNPHKGLVPHRNIRFGTDGNIQVARGQIWPWKIIGPRTVRVSFRPPPADPMDAADLEFDEALLTYKGRHAKGGGVMITGSRK